MSPATDKYEFRTATHNDTKHLLEMVFSGFLPAEPHCQALTLNESNLRELMRWLVGVALHTPYSIMAIEKATGKMAAFCLYSVGHRDESKDFEPFELDVDSMKPEAQMLCSLLDTQKKQIWTLRPNVDKVLRQEVIFVDPNHQRQGIAKHLINIVDAAKLKEEGFAGIQAEATSFANQQLLTLMGFAKLSESDPEEYRMPDGSMLTMTDGTKNMQLFFLPF